MNCWQTFPMGVIAAVGILVAVSLGFVAMDPDEIVAERAPVPAPMVLDLPPVDEVEVVESPPPIVSMPPWNVHS